MITITHYKNRQRNHRNEITKFMTTNERQRAMLRLVFLEAITLDDDFFLLIKIAQVTNI